MNRRIEQQGSFEYEPKEKGQKRVKLNELKRRQEDLFAEFEEYKEVFFINGGFPDLKAFFRPLLRRFEKRAVAASKGKENNRQAEVIIVTGMPGAGKTRLADLVREAGEIEKERLDIVGSIRVDFVHIPWEESEDELRESGVIATRGMAPDSIEDLFKVGELMEEKTAKAIREGGAYRIVMVEKPGGTFVNVGGEQIIERPYAPDLLKHLLEGEGVFADISRKNVFVSGIGIVGGPKMEILDYYRQELKRIHQYLTKGAINEARAREVLREVNDIFGIPVANQVSSLEELRTMQEGGSVETINMARAASDKLIDRLIGGGRISYPQYFDVVLRGNNFTHENLFSRIPKNVNQLIRQSNKIAEILSITTGDERKRYFERFIRNLIVARVLFEDMEGVDRRTVVLNNPEKIWVADVPKLRNHLKNRSL
ncbi:MAG: hypothetical protein ACOX6N_02590 [Patescibacteria group bacterium]|jgi:hypothetical protein